MSTTFQTAYTDMLDYINRPSSEMLEPVKRELNNTLLWMQRRIKFECAERLLVVAYPANTVFIKIESVCGGKPRDYLSFQLLSSQTATSGVPLRVKRYSEIVARRQSFERSRSPGQDIENASSDFLSFDSNFQQSLPGGRCVFTLGQNIGLYPAPSTTSYLLVNFRVFLKPFSAGADTNELLENCYDFVLQKTLARMSTYLKDVTRVPVDNVELEKSWESIVQWNSEISNPTPESIS